MKKRKMSWGYMIWGIFSLFYSFPLNSAFLMEEITAYFKHPSIQHYLQSPSRLRALIIALECATRSSAFPVKKSLPQCQSLAEKAVIVNPEYAPETMRFITQCMKQCDLSPVTLFISLTENEAEEVCQIIPFAQEVGVVLHKNALMKSSKEELKQACARAYSHYTWQQNFLLDYSPWVVSGALSVYFALQYWSALTYKRLTAAARTGMRMAAPLITGIVSLKIVQAGLKWLHTRRMAKRLEKRLGISLFDSSLSSSHTLPDSLFAQSFRWHEARRTFSLTLFVKKMQITSQQHEELAAALEALPY